MTTFNVGMSVAYTPEFMLVSTFRRIFVVPVTENLKYGPPGEGAQIVPSPGTRQLYGDRKTLGLGKVTTIGAAGVACVTGTLLVGTTDWASVKLAANATIRATGTIGPRRLTAVEGVLVRLFWNAD